jgi:hypothetical protein
MGFRVLGAVWLRWYGTVGPHSQLALTPQPSSPVGDRRGGFFVGAARSGGAAAPWGPLRSLRRPTPWVGCRVCRPGDVTLGDARGGRVRGGVPPGTIRLGTRCSGCVDERGTRDTGRRAGGGAQRKAIGPASLWRGAIRPAPVAVPRGDAPGRGGRRGVGWGAVGSTGPGPRLPPLHMNTVLAGGNGTLLDELRRNWAYVRPSPPCLRLTLTPLPPSPCAQGEGESPACGGLPVVGGGVRLGQAAQAGARNSACSRVNAGLG